MRDAHVLGKGRRVCALSCIARCTLLHITHALVLSLLFQRFAVWMWRNEPTRDFLVWLRAHNAQLPCEKRCGIWGLDLYSLNLAMQCVISYLKRHGDPEAAEAVRARYACFETFSRDPQRYGEAVARRHHAGCAAAALAARKRGAFSLLQPESLAL